jgi:hypothetical protein
MTTHLFTTSPLQQLDVLVTLLLSLGIIGRLLFYRKRYARHKMHMSVVAYGLAVAYFALVVRIVTGTYITPVDPSELAIHAALFLAVWMAGGNIARFLQSSPMKEKP